MSVIRIENTEITDRIDIFWKKDFNNKDSCVYEVGGRGSGLSRHLTDGCKLIIERKGLNLIITNTSPEPWNFLE